MGDVFVSWTRTGDEGGARALAAALEAAGLEVWLDALRIEPFDSIRAGVRDGLASSKVLVAWYSAQYPTRRACREELTLALLAAEGVHEGPKRVLVVNPEAGVDHVLEAPLLDRLFAGPDQLADLGALATRIAERVKQIDRPFGALPTPANARWYGGDGWQSGSTRFVGRLAQLWQIHDRLHRTSGLTGPGDAGRAVAVVSGFGGVGKSLLAAEYAHLFAGRYPGGIVWLSALGNDTTGRALPAAQAQSAADDQFSRVARWLDLDVAGEEPGTVREKVKSELDRRGQPVLWIVDDIPTGLTAAGLDSWRCRARTTVELITTRDPNHTAVDRIDLDVLEPPDAIALLAQGHALTVEDAEHAGALAEDLGCHPLACDVAGLYIAKHSTFADYRDLIAGNIGQFDELAAILRDQLPGDHAREITTTLATSLLNLGPDAWQLLRITTPLAPTAIPRNLLTSVIATLGTRTASDGFVARLLRLGREPAASPLLHRDAGVTVTRALEDPYADGLWRYDPGAGAAITVHVLVRAAAAALDPHPRRQDAVTEAVVDFLSGVLAEAADARHEAQTALALSAEHARHIVARPDEHLGPDTASLLLRLGSYDWAGGRQLTAAAHLGRAHAWYRENLGGDDPGTLTAANNLAGVLRALGDYAAARDLHQSTYDTLRRVLGYGHLDTLTSAGNLANSLSDLGLHAAARDLHQTTYNTLVRAHGKDHPDTLVSADNLGEALRELGRHAAARDLHQSTYDARLRDLGPHHPDTLVSANNLAEALHALGQHGAARDLHQSTYDTRERILGQDHPATLISANNLAGTLHALGHRAEARRLLATAHDALRRTLGENHPRTRTVADNLAALDA